MYVANAIRWRFVGVT